MKSKVYLIPVKDTDNIPTIAKKVKILCEESKVLAFVSKDDSVAVKMHFGEEGNTGFVKPEYVKVACDAILDKGAKVSLAETNTLYRGRRTNSRDHLAIAAEHGFTKKIIGVDVVIPDDSKKENIADVSINQKFIKTAKLARFFVEAAAIVAISHFKGHLMTGFGGALKNLGMGCASREGKLMQHSDISPVVYEQKCIGCGECEKACPVKAISLKNNKAFIDSLKCIGCATCIAVCPSVAIDVNWEAGGSAMPEKMIEYTFAVMKGKKDKSAFLNFAIKITKECDCLAKDDPRVSPDIGILASSDPVSIDKASLDLVVKACGRDIFKELHPHRDGSRQLSYAHELGLGKLDYELVTL
ncbi:MAG: DUF362 domain-containing protein [Candidatus Omnitrophota bacterium]